MLWIAHSWVAVLGAWLWMGCPQAARRQQTLQSAVKDIVEDRHRVRISVQGLQETSHVSSSGVGLWGAPMEVGNQGADVAGRVLFCALPLALPDIIYVPLEPLWPWTHACRLLSSP